MRRSASRQPQRRFRLFPNSAVVMSTHSIDQRIQAVRWKLGISAVGTEEQHHRVLREINVLPMDEKRQFLDSVAHHLSQPFRNAIIHKLTGQQQSEDEWSDCLMKWFVEWIEASETTRSPKINKLLMNALKASGPSRAAGPSPATMPKIVSPKGEGLYGTQGNPATVKTLPSPVPPPPAQPITKPPVAEDFEVIDDDDNVTPTPTPPPPPPAKWKYRPIESPLEPHAESECRAMDNAPAGWATFGARVRGRKHKLDGTNCDDAFDFRQVGEWTILAVSDGAGSKKYSRIGAKHATREAVAALAESVAGPELTDAETIRNAIIAAMQRARTAISTETASRATQAEFAAELGRPLDDQDLSCTLLVAMVCNTLDGRQMIYFSQVGDGMIGAIDRKGNAHVLGIADSGGHAGETEFLTSVGKSSADFLLTKSSFHTLDLQTLFVMSDGVADDYFPGTAELPRLWADILVNGIADVEGEASPATGGTPVETIAENPVTLTLHSASQIGIPPVELIRTPRLIPRTPLPGDTPQERLRLWIDAYQVRGSFDDRTLVLHHRRALP